MNPIVIGLSHKTAPIEVREKFFCNALQQELILSDLRSSPNFSEGLILSTCNRTEIYANAIESGKSKEAILKILFNAKGIEQSFDFEKHFYCLEGPDAIRHLLRVASSLESLVIGEKQILGQVKAAVELSRKKAMLGRAFNILTNFAIRTGKKSQTETDICFGGVSLSWAAVVKAEQVFGTLADKSVLILGAGKMSELASNQINKKGVREIFVMNRTQTCAEALATDCNGEVASFCDMKDILTQVDAVFCSVGAPHYILDHSTVQSAMGDRSERKLVFVDISMPRNIDPAISSIKNVSLFYIDDLDQVVEASMKRRQEAAKLVENIIDVKVAQYFAKISKLDRELVAD